MQQMGVSLLWLADLNAQSTATTMPCLSGTQSVRLAAPWGRRATTAPPAPSLQDRSREVPTCGREREAGVAREGDGHLAQEAFDRLVTLAHTQHFIHR
jgi:hypothetical protein